MRCDWTQVLSLPITFGDQVSHCKNLHSPLAVSYGPTARISFPSRRPLWRDDENLISAGYAGNATPAWSRFSGWIRL